MLLYMFNAFSLNMLHTGFRGTLRVEPVGLDGAARLARSALSCVGHADTAAVLSSILGVPVACNRATVTLADGDTALVCQYRGPRLPEGAATLPDGAAFEFYMVTVEGR